MQITDDQTDAHSLAVIGATAVRLLYSADYAALAERFGYALAFGRDPALAIGEDVSSCLARVGASGLGSPPGVLPTVGYFAPNDTGLIAIVEQRVIADNGEQMLIELIVSAKGDTKHVVLEQISACEAESRHAPR